MKRKLIDYRRWRHLANQEGNYTGIPRDETNRGYGSNIGDTHEEWPFDAVTERFQRTRAHPSRRA